MKQIEKKVSKIILNKMFRDGTNFSEYCKADAKEASKFIVKEFTKALQDTRKEVIKEAKHTIFSKCPPTVIKGVDYIGWDEVIKELNKLTKDK